MIKILAVNSSPKMNKGTTALILEPFLKGMREKGARVELVYTEKMNIMPCRGCFTCAIKTPGQCILRDDMQTLSPLLYDADIWVFASPLYVSMINGPMKTLMDRILIPLGTPSLELRDSHTHHAMREGTKMGKVLLVSSCGYWELDNFDLVKDYMKAFCWHAERDFAGALLRPHGPALKQFVDSSISVQDVFEAAREAGRELVSVGEMSRETLDVVSRELVSLEEYI